MNSVKMLLNGQLLTTAHLIQTVWVFVPVLVSGVIHMVIVKQNRLSWLAVPIHGGLLGNHKTYRGFLVVPIISGLTGFFLQSFSGHLSIPSHMGAIGFIAGLLYVAGELPNSLVKRVMGIRPGALPTRRLPRLLIRLLDYLDSFFPISFMCRWVFKWTLPQAIASLMLLIGMAVIAKRILRLARLK